MASLTYVLVAIGTHFLKHSRQIADVCVIFSLNNYQTPRKVCNKLHNRHSHIHTHTHNNKSWSKCTDMAGNWVLPNKMREIRQKENLELQMV